MKILSFHPFSLYGNGGGNRILRRLYEGREADITTLVVEAHPIKPHQGNIKETIVYASPVIQPWARWKIRNLLTWLRNKVFKPQTVQQIRKAAAGINYDVLHIVAHGTFAAAPLTASLLNNKKLWVSFHDHYEEIKTPIEDTARLWNQANRRLVISDALGLHYQQVFGDKPYEIITDGVKQSELSAPATVKNNPVTLYFAGLLHITYVPLFAALADALDQLAAQGHSFKLILRGTQNLNELNDRSFITEYRPVTLNSAELKAELDAADILYLPIKFTSPAFYLYSLSTKMVGYLAAPGTILYHGPADSAACKLLQNEQAAVCCSTLNVPDLAKQILVALQRQNSFSANARQLAKNKFDLQVMQNRFWLK